MFKKIFLFSLILYRISYSYVIRSNIIYRECTIPSNKVLNIIFNNNICNNDISQFDLFGFNSCDTKKNAIIKGINLWIKNTDRISVNFNSKLYETNFINITIKYKDTGNSVAMAQRYCLKTLLEGHIFINKNKCFYPDNNLCHMSNILLVFLLIFILFIHIFFIIVLVFRLKMTQYSGYLFTFLTSSVIASASLYIIYKCNTCSPLKTTIAHEFGHILGFAHPDEHYYYNYNSYYKNCKVIKNLDKKYDINSIMNSADIRIKNGLTLNDKLGLYDLYPSCKYSNNIYNNNSEILHNDNIVFFSSFIGYLCIFPLIIIYLLVYRKFFTPTMPV